MASASCWVTDFKYSAISAADFTYREPRYTSQYQVSLPIAGKYVTRLGGRVPGREKY
jgi:hypothetical protein